MTLRLTVDIPRWVEDLAPRSVYSTPEERMRLAIALARENVERREGGPFGAAVFERDSGRLVAAGVNLVLPMGHSVLHAEVVAIMAAEAVLGSRFLGAEGGSVHELVTSCEPCAMCLGAIHWSGVSRVVSGATRGDVEKIGFDEGPVFPQSYEYLRARGIEIESGVLRNEAAVPLERYLELGGIIYQERDR